MPATIVIFHNNLRLSDNRALFEAAKRGAIVPLFILDDSKADPYPAGAAARWWLQESLKDLAQTLQKRGVKLILRRGKPIQILQEILAATGANSVAWNRRYEPAMSAEDKRLQAALQATGVTVSIHDGYLLFDPARIRTGGGTPFKVFTPFSRACLAAPPPPAPVDAPAKLTGIDGIASDPVEDWRLVPRSATWPQHLAAAWKVSEDAAHRQLQNFIDATLRDYKTARDRPDYNGTSRLSPYLHAGQISPHQVWHAIQRTYAENPAHSASTERYLLEVLWREFSWHLLQSFPELPHKPLQPAFAHFPWREDAAGLAAWQKGLTGYPIVDAGMRQLWQTGWMHNRVRMIVASFLIKDLLIDWRQGAAWFWDTLVDADLGNNSASWQWVAGCGADAAPFFRIFNPTLQGQKFDPAGDYIRRYVPELSKLDARWIFEPWRAPPDVLAKAGIALGKNYPLPIVAHDKARQRALVALKSLSANAEQNSSGLLL